MDVPDILSLVQCTICNSHVNVKRLSDHICPLTQSHRFSQVSYYNSEYNPLTIQKNETEERKQLTLPELTSKRSSKLKAAAGTKSCSRCHHDYATLTVAKKLYHNRCFTCFVCRLPLDKSSFKVFEGQIYCQRDYNIIITRPTCSTCFKTIETYVRPTVASGKLFHPEHIRCHQCHKPIDPIMTGLVERKGKFYCQTDFNNLYLPKCESCHRFIEKEAIISSNNKLKGCWHKECFHCQLCNEPFPNNQFYIYKNTPYCKLHYYKANNLLCFLCSKPVEGPCGEISNGLKVHPGCFTCHLCQCNIRDIYFISKNRIYCQNHEK